MKKKIVFLLYLGLLFGVTFFLPGFYLKEKNWKGISTRSYVSGAGNHYTFFLPGESKLMFSLERPDKLDSSVWFCAAAAFTVNGKPDGIYGVNGKVFNADSINHNLGGAISIKDESVEIFSTTKGKKFSSGFVDSLKNLKAAFFQQIQMMVNGKAEDSKSLKKFQCRGIVKLKSGKVAVVESEEEISLKTFAADLAAEGSVKDLLYIDMGAWDEGWYKNSEGKLVVIGTNRSATEKQCNWIIFKKK